MTNGSLLSCKYRAGASSINIEQQVPGSGGAFTVVRRTNGSLKNIQPVG